MNNQPLSVLTFPIWWYSEGLQLAWRHCIERCRFVVRSTGLVIFAKNLFQPMYGDTTKEGRVISFFLRVIMIVFLFAWTVLRLALAVALFGVHLVALPGVVIMIIYQLFNLAV